MEKKKTEPLKIDTTIKDHAENVLFQLHRSDNAGPLVRSLSPHDFLTTWRMADDEQRADLLIIADKRQVELLIDLSCWPGDRPDLFELEELIRPTVATGIGGATRVLHTLSEGLRTLFLGQNARIHLLENRNDELQVPETSELVPCPDGYYFIEFPEPEQVTDVDRALFRALLLRPFEEYQLELESMRHEFPSQLEEASYQSRAGRLADYGFTVREDAISILAPRSVDEVRHLADKSGSLHHPLAGNLTLPILYRENLQGNEFVDQVLETLLRDGSPEATIRTENLHVEFTATANRFLTATGVDIGDPDAVGRGITQLRNLFAIGLYAVARGCPIEAVRLLLAIEFPYFVQVGFGRTFPLRDRARSVLGLPFLAPGGRSGSVFDPPHFVALSCLAQDVPVYWAPLAEKGEGRALSPELIIPHKEHLRAFASEEEIAEFAVFLEECEALVPLLGENLGAGPTLPAETPASILLLTCLGNMLSGRDPGIGPLSLEEAQSFFKERFDDDKTCFIKTSLAIVAPLTHISVDGEIDPSAETHTTRRLVLRLLHIGHARLKTGILEQSVLLQ